VAASKRHWPLDGVVVVVDGVVDVVKCGAAAAGSVNRVARGASTSEQQLLGEKRRPLFHREHSRSPSVQTKM
jgi:hypothetical protein